MIYRFGNRSLDTGKAELTRGGAPVVLEPQVLRLITCLIENRDRVVTKDELIEKVWKRRIVSDGALNTCINSARQALGDDGKAQAVIRTFPRHGFRFVAEITTSEAELSGSAAIAALHEEKPSIAVLPFDNMSGDPEQEYFADGMAEDLITDLSKIAGLFVVARNSTFALKGRPVDPKEISKNLGVKFVLEGSVRKMGPRLRVNAQLIDTGSGGHIWAERYDGNIAEIFGFQDDIREQIVSALRLSLTTADRSLAERKPTSSVEAYDLFLKGRASFHRFTADQLFQAKERFEEAIRIDANFADAYGYLSYCYFYAWFELLPGYDDGLRQAHELAKKGVAVDSKSAIAIAHLGWTQLYLHSYDEAVANFEKAVALAPSNGDICADFAQVLNYQGDPQRALDMINKAFALDAIAPPLWEAYAAHSLLLLKRYEDAAAKFLLAIERIPNFTAAYLRLAVAYVELGKMADARRAIGNVLQISPRYSVSAVESRYPYRIDAVRENFLHCLRRAELPEA